VSGAAEDFSSRYAWNDRKHYLRAHIEPKAYDKQPIKVCFTMYWTLELATKLEDAPWPATKEELIDYALRSGAPMEVVENLQELEDENEIYESIEDVWPDYPTKEDFLFNEDEY